MNLIDKRLINTIKNASRKTVDDTLKQNAGSADNTGLEVRVSRRYDGVGIHGGKECQWCLDRCGENMSLQEAMEKGAFQRHSGCGCEIEYTSKKGKTTWQYSKGGKESWKEKRDREYRKNYQPKLNKAKAIDSIIVDEPEFTKYTPEEIIQEMTKSPIGVRVLEHIEKSDVLIKFINEPMWDGRRGDQDGNIINIYLPSNNSTRITAQTLIHEMTHFWYNIGESQHAEAVCFSMEKMHLLGRDYLTIEEWNQMVKLAVDNYPEYKWEEGGYGDFSQFNFVRPIVKR